MAEPPAAKSFRDSHWWYQLGEVADGLGKVLIFVILWYTPVFLAVNAHTRGIGFVSGTRPVIEGSACSDIESPGCLWRREDWTWTVPAGATTETTVKPHSPGAVRGTAGYVSVRDGCAGARVAWQIFVGDDPVASGTVEYGPPQEVTSEPVAPPIRQVRITARRTDTASCAAVFVWGDMQIDAPWRVWPWELWPK
ncbi:hypothetical protein [Phytohabitans aurantiacus]|uniref:Uncharacterized protein n=1 Tax=Phytohabitans aurantiacus TaxID=3016789 RepID=A0ABQ5QVM5_9ACTN|nr:hypothetical protein [Phytohabitans aurantiacus]GLH98623.1 hypothetical protein Pa4123_38980 [Phytohabitans aurantiacus]